MDAVKPTRIHTLHTLRVAEEAAVDDTQLVPDSSIGSFSSENEEFFADFSGKEHLQMSPKASKKMSRYFKQKLKKTPNTLKRMTEQHRINERRRHNSLNSSIESLARLVPGHFNSQDTKVSILQKLLAYICFLEQKIIHYNKELGISTTYKRRYLSDYMATTKALEEMPDDDSQADAETPAHLLPNDTESDLSNNTDDQLVGYIASNGAAAPATLILLENGFFSSPGKSHHVECYHADELMETKYELFYAGVVDGKQLRTEASGNAEQMHLDVVKQEGNCRSCTESEEAIQFLVEMTGVNQHTSTLVGGNSLLSGIGGSLPTVSGTPSFSGNVLEDKNVATIKEEHCTPWTNRLTNSTNLRSGDDADEVRSFARGSTAAQYSDCTKQGTASGSLRVWSLEE